ncbi:unnamed protein product, partial [Meganyctiphanes norvegica]
NIMAGVCSVTKKYVSSKVKVVRWKPATTDFGKTNSFVTGSWDDTVEDTCNPQKNNELWRFPSKEDSLGLVSRLRQAALHNSVCPHQYTTRDSFAVGDGHGNVSIYCHIDSTHLQKKTQWDKVHKFEYGLAPSCALATNGDQIASVGEDGKLVILNCSHSQPQRIIDSVGRCSLYSVVYVRSNEVVTGNQQGHLKLWDLRSQQPAKNTLLSPDQISVTYLCGHPSQAHLIAAGGEDGALALWDMRNTQQPVTIIAAHEAPISEVRFHPSAPEHLFTCGMDGQILHWDASSAARSSNPLHRQTTDTGSSVNVWLSADVARGVIDTSAVIPTSPLPINSLDVEGPTLLAASDNEAIYAVRQVLLL